MKDNESVEAGQAPQPAQNDQEQTKPATPAPVSDEVRLGDTASSREYAEKLDKDLQGEEYIAGQHETDS